jgi:hypothetical protein
MIWSWGSFAIGYGVAALSAFFGFAIFAAAGRYDEGPGRLSPSDKVVGLSHPHLPDGTSTH